MTEQTEPTEQADVTGQPDATEQARRAEPQPPLAPPPAPPVPPAPRGDRRVLRAVLRWTAAVAVFAVAGAGTAYGITAMDRTDVPGLATASDGRWDYPTLTRPPLPSGSPGPLAPSNKAGAHYADLRALVLPAPKGAAEDPKLRGKDGWLATGDFLAEYAEKDDRDALRGKLVDHALRHVAARGWTTPDGTSTRIYLLHFGTAAVVDDLLDDGLAPTGAPAFRVRGADASAFDEDFPGAAQVDGVERRSYVEQAPYGAEQVRQAYLSAGDVLAVIVQSRKGGAKAVPFQQTVTLQSQLLG
ncbi:hypothetical protein ABT301_21855 [Streptomyces sp. NPDC000987]|uniref:hypothetical protein n=1 Tax=Streptomyces sp. NPDC000987 TaxID=3154374 RepID=UPI00332033F3